MSSNLVMDFPIESTSTLLMTIKIILSNKPRQQSGKLQIKLVCYFEKLKMINTKLMLGIIYKKMSRYLHRQNILYKPSDALTS